MREVLVQRLASWGWAAAAAGSVEEAESALERLEPEVVVSDVMLPDGSGLDVLRASRRLRRARASFSSRPTAPWTSRSRA